MISKRLEAIVDIVGETNSLIDIGADHGYVLSELLKRGKCFNLCGVENKIGPFETLKNNVKQYETNIKCVLSDGLKNVNEIYETVVIAGLGFSTIQEIILADLDKIKKSKYLVIDSHNHLESLRIFMNKNDFKIVDEKIIFEKNIYYSIIKYENGKEKLSNAEMKYGPILLKRKEDLFIEYLKNKKDHFEEILKNDLSKDKLKLIKKEIKIIDKILK